LIEGCAFTSTLEVVFTVSFWMLQPDREAMKTAAAMDPRSIVAPFVDEDEVSEFKGA
jgi:hypothetical protein